MNNFTKFLLVLCLLVIVYGGFQNFFLEDQKELAPYLVSTGLLGMIIIFGTGLVGSIKAQKVNLFVLTGVFFLLFSMVMFVINLFFVDHKVLDALYRSFISGLIASLMYFLFSRIKFGKSNEENHEKEKGNF